MISAGLVAIAILTLSPSAGPDAGKKEQARRDALWAAFSKVLPNGMQDIDAYGENQSLTEVCFSSGGQVYLFSLANRKVVSLTFQKYLPKINRIEFAIEPPAFKGGQEMTTYRLWSNGKLEMTCSATK
jgi:hypothetical protein